MGVMMNLKIIARFVDSCVDILFVGLAQGHTARSALKQKDSQLKVITTAITFLVYLCLFYCNDNRIIYYSGKDLVK